MKATVITCGFLSFSSLFTLGSGIYPESALAQCVQADIAVQYNISGSKTPTQRNNDVQMESDPNCQGNRSVTTSVQGNVGGEGKVQQNRRVRHRQQSDSPNPTGVQGPNVQVQTGVEVDVYNPAVELQNQRSK
jgi:hypothetical protein